MGYLEIHHCERQEFKKDCSSATHCCRRLAASGHDDFSLHSAKLDSLSSYLQLGRPRRRRGFVTKFSLPIVQRSPRSRQDRPLISFGSKRRRQPKLSQVQTVCLKLHWMKFHSCFQSFIHSPHVGTPVFCTVARPAND